MRFELEYLGETAVLVHGLDASAAPERWQAMARTARDAPGIVDAVPATDSLLLRFDPARWATPVTDPEAMDSAVAALARQAGGAGCETEARLHRIPVCYGGAFGPDLGWLAERANCTTDELVSRHIAVEYRVAMLGFAPGFAYLSGLDERLAAPRRERPRTCVPAGSVAIAGNQTGIYPRELPGGWRLIGRTPVVLFDPANEQRPCLLLPGDRVRFEAMTDEAFAQSRA